MKFENEFDVQAPIDEVYAALLDVERVAPCLPGAQVLEKTGDNSYKVAVKVKLGPITMQYQGDVEIVERDDAAHRAVMGIRARETRGQGTADATAEMRLEEREGKTHGTIVSDVQLSGRAASMGRGVIQDVSGRLVDQFSSNLATMLEGGEEAEPEAAAAGEPAAAGAPTDGGAAATAEAPRAAPKPPPAEPEEALSAADLAGAVIAGRLRDPKTVAGIVAIVALLLVLLRRKRD